MRIKWVDYAKAASIFLVVLGHSHIPLSSKSIIYAFHIPLFFFLSGLFFSTKKNSDFKSFIAKRTHQILIPYLFFNIITYIFWYFIGRHVGTDVLLNLDPLKPIIGIFYGNAHSHFLEHNTPLWFLACLFSVQTLYFFVNKIHSLTTKSTLIFSLIIIGYFDFRYNDFLMLPWGLNIAFVVIGFYGLGSLFSEKILLWSPRKTSLGFIGALGLGLVLLIANLNGKVEVSAHEYGNFLYFWIGAMAGIAAIISFSKLIETFNLPLGFIEYIGRNTLIIFALQLIGGGIVKGIAIYAFHLTLDLFDIPMYAFLYSIFSILVLIPAILILNKYFPYLIGKTISRQ